MPLPADAALLSTDFGIDALYEAAFDRALPTDSWPSPVDPATLVEHLLSRESDPAIAAVLRRARIRVRYRGPARPRLAFVAREPRPLPDAARAARDLEASLARALGERGFPPQARVTLSLSPDASPPHFAVALPSRWTPVTTDAGRAALAFRTLSASVSYAAATGDLELTASHPVHASLLAAEAGRAWFGDPRFFEPSARVSPRPLQRGARAFKVPADLASKIARVRMIELDWDSGRALNLHFAGEDCPREMKKLGLHIEAGALLGTTLRYDFTSAPRQADITFRPPNEYWCSEPSREPLIFEHLARKKVITRRRARRLDLWSLDPWTPSDAVARAFFGDAFEELVREGILSRSSTRAVVHPDYPLAGRTLIAFPIEGEPGLFYGATDGMRIPARTLAAPDLVSWRVELLALGKRMARALGLAGRLRVFERRGVVDLGTLTVGATQVRFFLLTRAPVDPKALGERLRLRAMPGHAVVLVPPGRKSRTGLPEVELARAHGPYDGLVADAARAVGLAKEIDPTLLAPPGTRLVVHLASRRVWFAGLLIEPLREQSYKMVEILAKLGGASIDGKQLAEQISLGNIEGATRQARHGLKLAIAATFARAGRPVPDDAGRIVESVRRGEVRLGVAVFVS